MPLASHRRSGVVNKAEVTAEITCFIVLGGTAALKLLSVIHGGDLMLHPDPIIPIPTGVLLTIVAIIELVICARLLTSHSVFEKCSLLSWIVLSFTTYRLLHWIWDIKQPCACLGTGVDYWPWLADHKALAVKGAYFILLCAVAFRLGAALLSSSSAFATAHK